MEHIALIGAGTVALVGLISFIVKKSGENDDAIFPTFPKAVITSVTENDKEMIITCTSMKTDKRGRKRKIEYSFSETMNRENCETYRQGFEGSFVVPKDCRDYDPRKEDPKKLIFSPFRTPENFMLT